MHPDLFPETLLVDVSDGHIFTTSLKVAEHFHKNHRNVLRAIHAIVERTPGPRGELNFALSSYLTRQRKSKPIYLLTRKGFEFVASGFTGSAADEWKWNFLDAFEAMEAQIAAHIAREAAALRTLRPLLAPVVSGTLAGQSRSAIGEEVSRSPASISYHRSSARRLGLLPQRKAA